MIYEMIDVFMSNMPIFEPSYFWDFMDTNDNVYTFNYASQKTKTIAQDQSSPVDEAPTFPFHDFNPFL